MDVWQPPPTCHGGGWERDISEREMMDETGVVKVEMSGTRGLRRKIWGGLRGNQWGTLERNWRRSRGVLINSVQVCFQHSMVFSHFILFYPSSCFFFVVHLLIGVDVIGHSFVLWDSGYACSVFRFILGVFNFSWRYLMLCSFP